MSAAIAEKADKYFSTLNSIAARIYCDINETKSSYEHLWDKLTPSEQSNIIDESIIKPEITSKYTTSDERNENCENEENKCGQKIIHDENCMYRDEFSAPFSYKTQSQIDLRVFTDIPAVPGSPLLNLQVGSKIREKNIEDNIFIDNYESNANRDVRKSMSISKDFSPISVEAMNDTPSETSHDEKSCLLPVSNIMKTGYDFLDNW